MMITPLGAGGGCHVSVMVVKVLLKAWSPPTSPAAKYEGGHILLIIDIMSIQINREADQNSYLRITCLSKTRDV